MVGGKNTWEERTGGMERYNVKYMFVELRVYTDREIRNAIMKQCILVYTTPQHTSIIQRSLIKRSRRRIPTNRRIISRIQRLHLILRQLKIIDLGILNNAATRDRLRKWDKSPLQTIITSAPRLSYHPEEKIHTSISTKPAQPSSPFSPR